MGVSPATINALRPLTDAEAALVALWVDWVFADVQAVATAAGVDAFGLDLAQVDRFIIEAVLYRLAHPDDATQVDVQVDDARVSRRYSSSTGQFVYQPGWWAWLGLPVPALPGVSSGAFTVTPYGAPDERVVDAWA